jgi:hypothetical protein
VFDDKQFEFAAVVLALAVYVATIRIAVRLRISDLKEKQFDAVANKNREKLQWLQEHVKSRLLNLRLLLIADIPLTACGVLVAIRMVVYLADGSDAKTTTEGLRFVLDAVALVFVGVALAAMVGFHGYEWNRTRTEPLTDVAPARLPALPGADPDGVARRLAILQQATTYAASVKEELRSADLPKTFYETWSKWVFDGK